MMGLVLLVAALFVIAGEACGRREEREAGVDVEEYASYIRASSPILITVEPLRHQHHHHQHHPNLHNATGEPSEASNKVSYW